MAREVAQQISPSSPLIEKEVRLLGTISQMKGFHARACVYKLEKNANCICEKYHLSFPALVHRALSCLSEIHSPSLALLHEFFGL